MKRILSLVLVSLVFISTAHSEEVSSSPSHLTLSQFEVGAIDAFQVNPSTNSTSGVVRWLPSYQLNSSLDLGLNLGISAFKSNTTTTFASLEYGATGTVHFTDNWLGRLTVGAQTWTGTQSQTSFALGATGIYDFSQPLLCIIHGVFISYAPVFANRTAHEVSLGAELKF